MKGLSRFQGDLAGGPKGQNFLSQTKLEFSEGWGG